MPVKSNRSDVLVAASAPRFVDAIERSKILDGLYFAIDRSVRITLASDTPVKTYLAIGDPSRCRHFLFLNHKAFLILKACKNATSLKEIQSQLNSRKSSTMDLIRLLLFMRRLVRRSGMLRQVGRPVHSKERESAYSTNQATDR